MTTLTANDIRDVAVAHAIQFHVGNPGAITVTQLLVDAALIETYIIGPAKAPLPDPNP